MCRINSYASSRLLMALAIVLIVFMLMPSVSLAGPTKVLNPNLNLKPGQMGQVKPVTPSLNNVNPNLIPPAQTLSPNVVPPGNSINPGVMGRIPIRNLPLPGQGNNLPGNNLPGNNLPGNNLPGNIPDHPYPPGGYPGDVTNINILNPAAMPVGGYPSTYTPAYISIIPYDGQCVLNSQTGTFQTAYGAPAWSDGKNMWVQSTG